MEKQLYTDPTVELVRLDVNIVCASSCSDPDETIELEVP